MNLPVPSTRSGYIAGILMTFIWILIYYCQLDSSSNRLFTIYSSSMYTRSIPLSSNCKDLPVDVYVRIPKHSSELIPGYIYFHVKNKKFDKQISDLLISVSGTGERDLFILPSVYTSNILPNTARFENIPPKGVVFFRLPLIFTQIEDIKIYVSVDNTNYVCDVNAGNEKLGPSGLEALKRAIVENLLLPPWSNLVIPTFAFVLVYFLESDDKEELNKVEKKTICLFFGLAFIESLFVYEFLIAFLLGSYFSMSLCAIVFLILLFRDTRREINNNLLNLLLLVRSFWNRISKLKPKRLRG